MINRSHLGVFFLLTVFSASSAQAAFVSDRLFLGIYSSADATAAPIKMLASGSEVEVLEEQGDYVRIKMDDGSEGWARAEFISTKAPASLTIKQVTSQRDQLQAQLNAIGVTEQTVTRLQRQLAEANQTIIDLRKDVQGEQNAALEQANLQLVNQQTLADKLKQKLTLAEEETKKLEEEAKTLKAKIRAAGGSTEDTLAKIAWVLMSMALSLVIGAVLGANWLSRRVRKRFNGRKVW
ncbi:MAG: TIGR04211 family SH3 domain-containing protein [Gammaproteobacteria bacterium]|nr:TIGR04211 family SH3 domain-containing protein [Gammaproteobacteria bacterium]